MNGTHTITITVDPRKAMRRAAWEAKRANMAEGRRLNRATTQPNKRKVQSKKACRTKGGWD